MAAKWMEGLCLEGLSFFILHTTEDIPVVSQTGECLWTWRFINSIKTSLPLPGFQLRLIHVFYPFYLCRRNSDFVILHLTSAVAPVSSVDSQKGRWQMVPNRLDLLHFQNLCPRKHKAKACLLKRETKEGIFLEVVPQGWVEGELEKSATLLPEWRCPWLSRPPLSKINRKQTPWPDGDPSHFIALAGLTQTEPMQRFEHACLGSEDGLFTSLSNLWKPFLNTQCRGVYPPLPPSLGEKFTLRVQSLVNVQ